MSVNKQTKASDIPKPKHNRGYQGKVSVELLRHFQCGHCEKWWSIGDAPPDRAIWYCPWCGGTNLIKENDVSK